METRRWRGHGTIMLGIDRLIIPNILCIIRPLRRNIGRQRHMADLAQRFVQRGSREIKAQQGLPVTAPLGDERIQRAKKAGLAVMAEKIRSPSASRLAGRMKASHSWADTRICSVAEILARFSPRILTPESCAGMTFVLLKTSRSPRFRKPEQIPDMGVDCRISARQHQKTRRLTRHHRAQGNICLGKVKIKLVNAHG